MCEWKMVDSEETTQYLMNKKRINFACMVDPWNGRPQLTVYSCFSSQNSTVCCRDSLEREKGGREGKRDGKKE